LTNSSEGIFAAANIFSSLKVVYMFTINSHLGPLQISLGRAIFDILKFVIHFFHFFLIQYFVLKQTNRFFVFISLVLFSFACGLNQLYWYYAQMRETQCESKDFETVEQREECFLNVKYFSK
jgi:hypothetical protein